jgi:RNA polymerase sigma factor (sigma-70 family)
MAMTDKAPTDEALRSWAEAALGGDREAAQRLLEALQDPVYRLALRMLGHPADAEDAAQEILVIVLTHIGSFRGESALSTWVFRIAVNHLMRTRKGRREMFSFDLLGERLDGGLRETYAEPSDPEIEVMVLEVRLRCTEAMLLSLDRELRIAFILGDIFRLSGQEAAQVLEVDAATYRKRLSRSRKLLLGFMRGRCGVFDPENPCRCRGQVDAALADGRLRRDDLSLAHHPARVGTEALRQGAKEVGELLRVADVMRGHPDYAAPEPMLKRLRALLDSGRLELLRN